MSQDGLCQCGCGRPTRIAPHNIRRLGHVKGQPVRYIRGHNARGKADASPERFWKSVDRRGAEECWPWLGSKDTSGYGTIMWGGRRVGTHVLAYELVVGAVPEGLVIDHLCRNRACCNPAHLEPVTHRENVLRGRGPTAINARKTHCNHGHEFTPENTYLQQNGGRGCRECHRNITREWARRNRRKSA